MDTHYAVNDLSRIPSPALLFYKSLIEHNIAAMVRMARSPDRLRPHAKTHKTREITRLEHVAGITKHKCATLAEAEMLAQCDAPDVLIAYPIVGPNCGRLAQLIRKYPRTSFAALADHPSGAEMLDAAMVSAGVKVKVMLDLDVGMHRTGIAPGPDAERLYESFTRLPGLIAAGISAYDGHNNQESREERSKAASSVLTAIQAMRKNLEAKSIPVPALVIGGTPTFPIFAGLDIPGLECSPGTCVLSDHGYGSKYRDMPEFVPAALLLTRIISKPGPNRLTLDLGSKALAADPPAGKRCVLLDIPDCTQILQNEEHLAVETPAADRYKIGDAIFAMPTHICPTCAAHNEAFVIDGGNVIGTWEIAARGRRLTV